MPKREQIKKKDRKSRGVTAGEGGLVRGSDGGLLRAFCAPVAASSSFEAELLALIQGLAMTMELSTHIWIELNSAALVSLLSSGHLGAADFRHHMALIRSMTSQRHVRFSHIYRERNRAGRYGVQTPAFTYFDPISAPQYLKVLVRMDQLGYPNFRYRHRDVD
ncbi:uncharacterized protein LOC121741735 [Salvia splendens]|uniref:uncharacterized protein LOC121741735 n=1 Tax=Salvia splendens TaxID=180675 RepID=UPI001C25DBCD|nr:uncharacterized protein LOC121741735 [Salvia splendens]